jgi:uncharacterized protein (TIGR02117 family)
MSLEVRRLAARAGLGWLMVVCGATGAASAADPQVPVSQHIPVHVVSNGWHAGLLLPAASLNAWVPSLAERFPQAQAYEVGWGDEGFYQAREVSVGLAFQALFASRGSLLHVVGVTRPAKVFAPGQDVVTWCVSADQLQSMAQRIAQAFELGADGKPVPKGRGLYGDSQFYQARGTYSWRHTCNRWSAEVLQAGGLPIASPWSLTADSVLSAVRQAGRQASCAASGS